MMKEMPTALLLLMISIAKLQAVNGCGQLIPGQERTVNFNVTDFKLPPLMVYSEDPTAKTKVSNISSSKGEAEGFVRRFIMQSVEDVLYQQGRGALLPDSVISSILQQLDVQIEYEALNCEAVIIDTVGNANGAVGGMKTNCVIVGGTVTSTCSGANPNMCNMAAMLAANSKPVPPKHMSISGILKTSNAVMANWSSQMWQSVLNRVLRTITTSSIGTLFFGASVNIR